MTSWLFKLVPTGDYAEDQERFAQQVLQCPSGPSGPLAVASSVKPEQQVLIASVPDGLRIVLDGFEVAPPEALPKAAVFLVGNQDDFSAQFAFDVPTQF